MTPSVPFAGPRHGRQCRWAGEHSAAATSSTSVQWSANADQLVHVEPVDQGGGEVDECMCRALHSHPGHLCESLT
jgi:hypothetical protein